jgi:hypothetical protein
MGYLPRGEKRRVGRARDVDVLPQLWLRKRSGSGGATERSRQCAVVSQIGNLRGVWKLSRCDREK